MAQNPITIPCMTNLKLEHQRRYCEVRSVITRTNIFMDYFIYCCLYARF